MTATDNIEREVKLEVGLRFTLPDLTGVLPGVRAVPLSDARLRAVYIDTSDLRLMRWGVTLRHRVDLEVGGSGESGWTLKLPEEADGVALVRRELSWPGRFGPVPEEVRRMVRAQARTMPLEVVARLTTQRRRVELRDAEGRRLAEIDDDVVSVLDGRRLAARFREVEVETAAGASPQLLEAVLERMTEAGALTGDDRPKVVRALGPRAQRPPDVVVPALDRDSTIGDVIRASIAAALTRMVTHDAGVRLGDEPEHVHQARVGTRRLRSDLRTFRPLLDPGWLESVRAELGWVADALGGVRDADVLTERLRAQIARLPLVDARPAAGLVRRLAAQREQARTAMLAVLDSDRYVALLDELARAAAVPPLLRPAARPGLDGPVARTLVAVPSPPADQVTVLVLVPRATASAGPGAGGADLPPAPTAPTAPPGSPAPDPSPLSPMSPAPGRPVGAALVGPVPPDAAGTHGPGGGTNALDAGHGAPADAGAGSDAPATGAAAVAGGHPTLGAHHNGTAVGPPPGGQPAREVLPGLVRTPWRHLQRAVSGLGDSPPDEALHEVRIRSKRLRYAAEAAVGVMGRPAKSLAVAVAEVQGVLGDFQDAVVAEEWLRRTSVAASAGQALVAGELIAVEREQQAAGRRDWVKPWKAASAPKLRTWLKG